MLFFSLCQCLNCKESIFVLGWCWLLMHHMPLCSWNLIVKLQVAVPPSAKAMNWFFSQPLSSAVFPLFFLSKETENLIFKSLSLGGACGVFGIGAAVRFTCPSFSTLGGQNSFKRLILPLYLLSFFVILAYSFGKSNW